MISAYERTSILSNESGAPSLRFAEWIEGITNQVNFNTVAQGSGSPEGVLAAAPTKLYMDTAGAAGSILYVKKTGNGSTGWVLV